MPKPIATFHVTIHAGDFVYNEATGKHTPIYTVTADNPVEYLESPQKFTATQVLAALSRFLLEGMEEFCNKDMAEAYMDLVIREYFSERRNVLRFMRENPDAESVEQVCKFFNVPVPAAAKTRRPAESAA
jgi:hypothetical protein